MAVRALILLAALLAFGQLLEIVTAVRLNSQKYLQTMENYEDLSGDGRYLVKWEVDLDSKSINFELIVETTGFVGFGFSPNGGMTGADVFIAGVYPNGTTYFDDYFSTTYVMPTRDTQQDGELIFAMENSTHTHLKFSRLLETCDAQDLAITGDTIKLIWSFGSTDTPQWHGATNRGTYSANLLDIPMPPFDPTKYDKWTVQAIATMPARPTTYWCSIHRSPTNYTQMRHVVGFNTLLVNADSKRYTHHLDVYKCEAPPGIDPSTLFEPLVGYEGEDCIVPDRIPQEYCRTLIYVWAVGGRLGMMLPDHVGYPINVGGSTEYLLTNIHYNNPESVAGLKVTTTVEFYSTTNLRPENAALLVSARSISYSHLIPPKATKYVTVSHCGPACTSRKVRPEGINFFNVYMHSHLLGRKMKLRHFRGNVELPWVSTDDHYDFDFQQNRPLKEEILFLPGDQLSMECESNSAARTGITTGGLPTTDEMCQAVVWYYPAGELQFCESTYPEAKIIERYGIEEIRWDNIMERPIVLAPPSLAGKTFNQVVDQSMNWTREEIEDLQQELRYGNHQETLCGGSTIEDDWVASGKIKSGEIAALATLVTYPVVEEEYSPPESECGKRPTN